MATYLTRSEVALHNNKDDCWVIVDNKVYDVTAIVAESHYDLAAPLLSRAGDDVSHWFLTDESGVVELKTFIDPISTLRVPYLPEGRFPHVPTVAPLTSERTDVANPWWKDATLVVGTVTRRPRLCRIVNTLTSQEHFVEFSDEETVGDMQHKFLEHNAHCVSYTWKALIDGRFRPLDPKRTLAQNGVPDDTAELERLGLDPRHPENLTTVMLFFNDDLTTA